MLNLGCRSNEPRPYQLQSSRVTLLRDSLSTPPTFCGSEDSAAPVGIQTRLESYRYFLEHGNEIIELRYLNYVQETYGK